jgi:DNA-binding IclR family transcriptional regulator
VLDKAVAILRAVAQEPASLADLVARTDLPRATAHRLAVALEGHRLLRRTLAGTWAPGPALTELSHGSADLARVAGRHLATLRDTSGESAQFYVREGGTRVCVAAAERAHGLRDTVPVGARLPMTAGSAAHALLAFAPPEEVTPLLPQASFTARTLLDVRRRGLGAQRRRARARRRLALRAGARPGRRGARRGVDLRPGRAAGVAGPVRRWSGRSWRPRPRSPAAPADRPSPTRGDRPEGGGRCARERPRGRLGERVGAAPLADVLGVLADGAPGDPQHGRDVRGGQAGSSSRRSRSSNGGRSYRWNSRRRAAPAGRAARPGAPARSGTGPRCGSRW